MGNFGCSCGNKISLNFIPEFCEAVLITDIALDNVAGEDVSADRLPRRLVYECDACGRLWIQATPAEGADFLPFVPERAPLKFLEDYGKGYREEPRNEDLDDPVGLTDENPPVLNRVKFGAVGTVRNRTPSSPLGDVRRRLLSMVRGEAIDEDDEPPTVVEGPHRRPYAFALCFEVAPRQRSVFKTLPLDYKFRVQRVLASRQTPDTIVLHHRNLGDPAPLALIFAEDTVLTYRSFNNETEIAREIGQSVEFDVENVGNEVVGVKLEIFGVAEGVPNTKILDGAHLRVVPGKWRVVT